MFFGKNDEENKSKEDNSKENSKQVNNKQENSKDEKKESVMEIEQESKNNMSDEIKKILGKSNDVVFMKSHINANKEMPISIVYIDGMIDGQKASEYVLEPLIQGEVLKDVSTLSEAKELIEQGAVYYSSQKKRYKIDDIIKDVITGSVAVILDDESTAFTFEVKGFQVRNISEPTSENVKKGAKDAFIETIRANTAAVRRRIKTPDLVIEEKTIGKQSLTTVSLVYISGLTNMNIVEDVKKRLDNINIDQIYTLDRMYEYLSEGKEKLFPTIDITERPDKFCSDICDGRVGLIIDGTPYGMIAPAEFAKFLQAPEDYSQHPIISTLLTMLRYISMMLTLVLPGFYIAVTTFHPEMIPTDLTISIAQSKEGVPFPVFVEIIIMLIAFEILVEASLRLPKTIGQAVSIVGALVVGEAAVNAKIVSPAVVIIIALAVIASFVMPDQDMSNALRIWRFILVIFSSIIGLFGLTIGIILLIYKLASMETFGVPYLAPYAGVRKITFNDVLLKLPIQYNKIRPQYLNPENNVRLKKKDPSNEL